MVKRVPVVAVYGPLAGLRDQFGEALTAAGYTPLSAANQLRLMAHVSRWMASESVAVGELTDEAVDRFLAARREAGYTCWLSRRGLGPLIDLLRSEGLAPAVPAPVLTERDLVVAEFAVFLRVERGLAEATVEGRLRIVRHFLAVCGEVAGVDGAAVSAYVSSTCPSMSVSTAKLVLTGIRSLLRFLHVTGRLDVDLSPVVLGAAGWRHTGLPKGLSDGEVSALLAECSPDRPSGRRDRAIVLLLVRLGLRRVEVARLELGDIDWRAGVITVVGKGNRAEQLPLPVEVGEALVDYLRLDRPRDLSSRAVFVSLRAPYGSLSGPGVGGVVQHLAGRAGLGSIGPHRFRHTAATGVLREGGDLVEVGQLLRHRHLGTTAIYAKVDLVRLHLLARPWPRTTDTMGGLRRLAQPWPLAVMA